MTKRSNYVAHWQTVPADNQSTVAWHQVHQTPKRELYRIEILVDVRMIEFDVVDNRDFREVVHELRAFIKIGRVVFVAFDDEVVAVGHAKTDPKVLHYSAHQERRIQSGLIDYPGRQAGRGRLAVRAGNDQRTTPTNEFVFQNFGKRPIDEPPIQSLFNFRIAARNRVADDNAIRRRI